MNNEALIVLHGDTVLAITRPEVATLTVGYLEVRQGQEGFTKEVTLVPVLLSLLLSKLLGEAGRGDHDVRTFDRSTARLVTNKTDSQLVIHTTQTNGTYKVTTLEVIVSHRLLAAMRHESTTYLDYHNYHKRGTTESVMNGWLKGCIYRMYILRNSICAPKNLPLMIQEEVKRYSGIRGKMGSKPELRAIDIRLESDCIYLSDSLTSRHSWFPFKEKDIGRCGTNNVFQVLDNNIIDDPKFKRCIVLQAVDNTDGGRWLRPALNAIQSETVVYGKQ